MSTPKTGSLDSIALGQLGGTHITSASGAVTGDWGVLDFLDDTTITSLTSSTIDGQTFASVTLNKGTVLYGKFTAIQVSTGRLIAYNRVPV